MNYHFNVHKEENGFWADCVELLGCSTQADTLENLKNECKQALDLYLEEPKDSKMLFPLPNEALDKDHSILNIEVEPEIALAILLRHFRIKSNITQKEMAQKLGMKNLYSYQRLEKRSNTTIAVIKKIHNVFPEIKLEKIV
jgi:predicted RNase H-like HicB family nuclease/DNA-binding XRE family transcriptional regulator